MEMFFKVCKNFKIFIYISKLNIHLCTCNKTTNTRPESLTYIYETLAGIVFKMLPPSISHNQAILLFNEFQIKLTQAGHFCNS